MKNVARRVRAQLWRLSMKGLPRGPHITRYAMYKRLAEVGRVLPVRCGRVLSIGHSENLCDVLGLVPTEVVEANYPQYNMLSLAFPDNSFDFVLSDQVLEHIEGNPEQAISECLRLLRPGGLAVHTTCFINPIHEGPRDFWRFTPDALRLLAKGFGDVIECAGWGNFEVWSLIRDGLRYDGIPHARWHPLHRLAMKNDAAWPIVTWVVARK